MASAKGAGEGEKERVEKLILAHFADAKTQAVPLQSDVCAAEYKADHQLLDGVLRSLQSANYVKLTTASRTAWTLTAEGADYAQNGTPEVRVWEALETPRSVVDLDKALGNAPISVSGRADSLCVGVLRGRGFGVSRDRGFGVLCGRGIGVLRGRGFGVLIHSRSHVRRRRGFPLTRYWYAASR